MKFNLTRLLFLVCLFGISVMHVQSQTIFLDIKKWDDTQKSSELSTLRKMTFSGTNLILNYLTGINETVETSSIRKMVFSSFTGIESNMEDAHAIQIYPNPSTDYIFLKNLPEGDASIDVYSINGIQIMNQRLHSANEQIDLSRLSKGIYFIKVNTKVLKFTKL